METKRLTNAEREALVRLNIAMVILLDEPENLRVRAGLVPGAKRDLGMLAARIKTLMEKFAQTIPDEQVKTYVNALKMASYTIGVRRPGGEPRDDLNYGLWLPNATINALLDGCKDHCLMCSGDTEARRRCVLRKALDMVPNDVPHDVDDCPYYEAM